MINNYPLAVIHQLCAFLLFGATQGWNVVRHRAFTDWLKGQVDRDYVWLVLDPLVDASSLGVDGRVARERGRTSARRMSGATPAAVAWHQDRRCPSPDRR